MGRKLALAALAALLLAGCGASDPEAGAPGTTAAPATPIATPTTPPPAPAPGNGPEIRGTGLAGEALDIAEFRGKPVFVNVWSSW